MAGADLTTSEATFRILSLTDFEPLADLTDLEQLVFDSSSDYDEQPWDLEALSRVLPEKFEISLVAVDQVGSAVGFLIASRKSSSQTHIHRLAVSPAHQGTGIGSWLLSHFIAGTSADTVTVNCDAANLRAIELYRSAGFISTGRNADQKLELTLQLAAKDGRQQWYIYTATRAESGHAAHIPRLVEAMQSHIAIRLVPYGTQELPPFAATFSWAKSFRELMRSTRIEGVDVIFVRIHWPLASLLFLANRVYPGRKFRVALWSSGGVGYLADQRVTPRERANRFAHRFAVRYLNDAVVTGPPKLADEYRQRYKLPARKLILGCNDVSINSWSALANEPEVELPDGYADWLAAPHKLLYLHGVDRIRGADQLPEIMSSVSKSFPNAKLLVVGDGPLDGELTPRTDTVCVGRVSNSAAAAIVSRADCMLVPSRQEGFPRVLLEAMALGVPPAVFDVGGCREVLGVRLAELVAQPGDVTDFARAVIGALKMVEDPNFREQLKSRAAEFDTPAVARGLALALRTLASGDVNAATWLARAYWGQVFSKGRGIGS